MNAKQISQLLHHHKHFVGVFASNQLPHIDVYPFSLVVNNMPDFHSGEHWYAIFALTKNDILFFDSYALNLLPKLINRFLTNLSTNIHFNPKQVQSIDADTCGHHCVYFIDNQNNNYGIRTIFKSYTNKVFFNDMLVKAYVFEKSKILSCPIYGKFGQTCVSQKDQNKTKI